MPLTLSTNLASLEAQRNLTKSNHALSQSFERLSSGYRINSAGDDAAGLAISESMKSQIRSYNVAERNAADGISMAQTAESALGEVHDILGRMRELSMQASNGSLQDSDRGYIDTEFQQLKAEISRIQAGAKFNNQALVGSATNSVTFQVGLNNDPTADQITINFGGVNLSAMLATGLVVSGADGSAALSTLSVIDQAITNVSTARSTFGAAMNRLEAATSNIQTMRVNLQAANSRIVDVDVASETATMSRNQVLTQAGTSVLAQANQLPQLAMSLLK